DSEAVHQGPRQGHRGRQDLRRDGQDDVRRHHFRARRREGAADRGVVPQPRQVRLLGSQPVPPRHDPGHLRAPVWRPDRYRLGGRVEPAAAELGDVRASGEWTERGVPAAETEAPRPEATPEPEATAEPEAPAEPEPEPAAEPAPEAAAEATPRPEPTPEPEA